jgi:hypothetical protein
MQQGLGVAAGLLFAFEDEVASRLVGSASFVFGHVFVERVAFILAIDHACHALQGFFDLRLSHHAVVQPVSHVLAADAQRGAVFHEADAVDVGHFGAAHALVNPAHDIAQDALGCVDQLARAAIAVPSRV